MKSSSHLDLALAALLFGLSACARAGSDPPDPACAALFGRPNEKTGLDETQCKPSCDCGGSAWQAPEWSPERIAALGAWALLDPPVAPAADPYAAPVPPADPGAVCAVRIVDAGARTYRLQTFASAREAEAAGGVVTHHDACGLCSTLADLAVYARELDLTAPVRQCGVDTLTRGFDADVACLEQLGFTHACAQIWAHNTQHTREKCFEPCFSLITAPYHEESGALNACLRCDETESGPVFKHVAGRTRRNTGIASALCRPCDQVHRIAHDYR